MINFASPSPSKEKVECLSFSKPGLIALAVRAEAFPSLMFVGSQPLQEQERESIMLGPSAGGLRTLPDSVPDLSYDIVCVRQLGRFIPGSACICD